MANRTTDARVIAVLRNGSQGGDYDDKNNPALDEFITAANLFTTRVNTCASTKGITLSSYELAAIETWMAAYFYAKSDRVYSSKATAGASGAFVLDPQTPEPYKKAAMDLDPSGCVSAMLNKARVFGAWIGRAPSAQTDYVDRD